MQSNNLASHGNHDTNLTISRAVTERVRHLVKSIEHASKVKAHNRLSRCKNELRTLVKKYGIAVMQDVYAEWGFTPDRNNGGYEPRF